MKDIVEKKNKRICRLLRYTSMKFLKTFLQKPNPYGPKGLLHEIFENRIRFGRDIRLLNISAYTQSARKSFPRMLSQRLNHFLFKE